MKRLMIVILALLVMASSVWAANVTVTNSEVRSRAIVVTPQRAMAIGASGTTNSFTLRACTTVHSLSVKLPNYTNSVTGTLTITDANSYEVYSYDSIAKNATTHIYNLDDVIALDGLYTVLLTLSGAPGGSGGTAYVVFWMK